MNRLCCRPSRKGTHGPIVVLLLVSFLMLSQAPSVVLGDVVADQSIYADNTDIDTRNKIHDPKSSLRNGGSAAVSNADTTSADTTSAAKRAADETEQDVEELGRKTERGLKASKAQGFGGARNGFNNGYNNAYNNIYNRNQNSFYTPPRRNNLRFQNQQFVPQNQRIPRVPNQNQQFNNYNPGGNVYQAGNNNAYGYPYNPSLMYVSNNFRVPVSYQGPIAINVPNEGPILGVRTGNYLYVPPTPMPVVPPPPSRPPTPQPSRAPTPTDSPTQTPTATPTLKPSQKPTELPTQQPTKTPTTKPTKKPTDQPTKKPTHKPSKRPTKRPTRRPTKRPSRNPTRRPTRQPTRRPTRGPTNNPTKAPTNSPVVG